MQCQILFSGKKKEKNISNMSSAEGFTQSETTIEYDMRCEKRALNCLKIFEQ